MTPFKGLGYSELKFTDKKSFKINSQFIYGIGSLISLQVRFKVKRIVRNRFTLNSEFSVCPQSYTASYFAVKDDSVLVITVSWTSAWSTYFAVWTSHNVQLIVSWRILKKKTVGSYVGLFSVINHNLTLLKRHSNVTHDLKKISRSKSWIMG